MSIMGDMSRWESCVLDEPYLQKEATLRSCMLAVALHIAETSFSQIQGALNIHKQEDLFEFFLKKPLLPSTPQKRLILVFHCEFSSERGPKMWVSSITSPGATLETRGNKTFWRLLSDMIPLCLSAGLLFEGVAIWEKKTEPWMNILHCTILSSMSFKVATRTSF